MLARIRKAREEGDSGFTLIELLVVMIIIGILAAIAIPAFLNQRDKAKSTAAKADASSVGKEVSAYFVDNTPLASAATLTTSGSTWTVTGLTALTGKLSAGSMAEGSVQSDTTFCVTVWNTELDGTTKPAAASAKSAWKYDAVAGLAKGVC